MLPFRFYTTLLILSLSHLLKFHIPLLPCPVALRGVFATQNIGEVARSDGGVNLIEGAESTGGGVKSRPSFVYRK